MSYYNTLSTNLSCRLNECSLKSSQVTCFPEKNNNEIIILSERQSQTRSTVKELL